MENLAHSLTGACIAMSGFQSRIGRRTALAVGIVTANLPDIDAVTSFTHGHDYYMDWHRGLTHSLLALGVVPPLVAGIAIMATRARFGWLLALAFLGYGSHLLLDLVTSWGTMVLLPFSDRRFATHWVFIVDPWFWAILGLPVWARLLTRRHTVVLSRTALATLALYVGSLGALHALAVREVAMAARSQSLEATRLRAYPTPFHPSQWQGVADDGTRLYSASIDLRAPGSTALGSPVSRDLAEPAVAAVARTDRGRRFLQWWADSPYATVTCAGADCQVALADLRYRSPWISRPGFELVFRVVDDGGKYTVRDAAWRSAWRGGGS